jgi:antitoxin ParD1/3/4
MSRSLHVSLPEEMRAYVDLRTNGQNAYSTPEEYVRALIRKDMEQEQERLYVFKMLLQGSVEADLGVLEPLTVLDDIENEVLSGKH